jgi:GNAT superfamily N-acetyltransferase
LIREILPPDTAVAFEAMRPLRPHHDDRDEFVRRVDEEQRLQGYRLVGAFDDEGGRCEAVAGFRVIRNLAWGDCLYVDDLSTRPDARRRGHGRALMEWCMDEAARLGCDELHLDSGVGPEREDAHRLYFNLGLRITSYHFARSVRRGRSGTDTVP